MPITKQILERAKELRTRQTDAERFLWQVLRGRNFGGFKFRRQKPIGNYIVDFYCAEKRLAIELDGGGHADDQQMEYDEQRTNALVQKGITLVRFWNHEVFQETEAVLKTIWEKLHTLASFHR